MPVFEYRCADCNNKFEVFHKSTNHQDEVVCPSCNSSNNKKLLSSFSASFEGSTSSLIVTAIVPIQDIPGAAHRVYAVLTKKINIDNIQKRYY